MATLGTPATLEENEAFDFSSREETADIHAAFVERGYDAIAAQEALLSIFQSACEYLKDGLRGFRDMNGLHALLATRLLPGHEECMSDWIMRGGNSVHNTAFAKTFFLSARHVGNLAPHDIFFRLQDGLSLRFLGIGGRKITPCFRTLTVWRSAFRSFMQKSAPQLPKLPMGHR